MQSLVNTVRLSFVKKSRNWSMMGFALASGIPRTWLIAFRDDKIKNPGADRIHKLQKFLETI